MDGRQHQAAAWHAARFPDAQPYNVALKAMEELGEVAEALNGVLVGGRDGERDRRAEVADEAADVAITMLVLLGRWFPEADLAERVDAKLAKLTDPTSTHRSSLPSSASTDV